MRLRVAIVGCGKIADSHVEQVRAVDMADVVAVCDREPLMAEQLAKRHEIPRHDDDYGRMLEQVRPDVVHVATPPDSHRMLAERAFAAGCHVFLEKPVAPTAADAAAILAAAAAAGREVSVNYLYNFESPSLRLRALLDSGALGGVVHVESSYGYDLAGDYGVALLSDPGHWVHRLPGGLFHNVLDHVVCKLALVMPREELDVRCIAWRRRPAVGNPVVDALADELRFVAAAGGVTAGGTVSAHARPPVHQMRVYGTRDSIELDYGARTLVPLQRQTQPSALGRLFPPWRQSRAFAAEGWRNARAFGRHEFHFFHGMRLLLRDFYACIQRGGPRPVPWDAIDWSARAIDRFVDAIRAATAGSGR